MNRMNIEDYQRLIGESEVIEKDAYGEKVLRTEEGSYVKIFRTRRALSTAVLWPYARRFCSNAAALSRRHIETVKILDLSYCRPARRHLVRYAPVAGITLREALREAPVGGSLVAEFARFLAGLHEKGVYFRSIHFGNVIVQPGNGALALIDIGDMSFRRAALGAGLRARNFRHFLRYQDDVDCLEAFGTKRFVDLYLESTMMSPRQKRNFCREVTKLGPFRAAV